MQPACRSPEPLLTPDANEIAQSDESRLPGTRRAAEKPPAMTEGFSRTGAVSD
jgi:hypothetical protein